MIVFPPPDAADGVEGVAGAGPEEQPAVIQAKITMTVQTMQNTRRECSGIISLRTVRIKKVVLCTNQRPAILPNPEKSETL